jgi:tRNA A-37 threonylcarbamoyl transferase component Bud32
MSEAPEALKEALADRYELGRTVGRGGMAAVYLARDRKHGREVAVKVLRPDLAASIGTDRFLNEIEIAARLNHPHIVPLFDSGEADSFLFYAMPFIDGESLRGLMNREGRLGLPVTTEITREVADALSYAHREGVLHRDIKPENILLSDGHAFVADFGIAKAVSTAGGEALTRSGFPLGTVGYMSPEQAAGVRKLDVRTDVYSLACVVYEMLVGETPGLWLTTEAVQVGRFVDAEAGHRTQLDRLPGRLEQVLAKALAMRPVERFATPTGFVDALMVAAERGPLVSDEEMRKIIGRASELQAGQPTEEGALSIGSVEQIAAQVGIPPDRVREALQELEERAVPPRHAVAPPYQLAPRPDVAPIRMERTVGGILSERQVTLMVEKIRSVLGTLGQVSSEGDKLTWTSSGVGGVGRNVRVMLTPTNDRTEITVEEFVGQVPGRIAGGIAGWCCGGIFGIAFGGLIAVPELFGIGFAVSGAYFLSRSVYMNTVIQRERQLEELANVLAKIGSEP